MPRFTRNLEKTLHSALSLASKRNHAYATLEHLLLALTVDSDAAQVLVGCNCDLQKLQRSLLAYMESELDERASNSHSTEPEPNAGFQRAVQRAVIQVDSSGREAVTGAHILVALLGQRESYAARLLAEQGMTRDDAVKYLIALRVRPGG
jgi:ATP-dependent Clp protease ATP-binding subunit ClpA